MKRLVLAVATIAAVAAAVSGTDVLGALDRVASGGIPSLLPAAEQRATATVVRVVDGDTLRVRVDGREQVVRAVAIDTPETVRPGRSVECGGLQASAYAKRLLRRGSGVELVDEPGGDPVDRYGRRLAWVELPAGGTFQGRMVRAGWATVYRYDGRRSSRDAELARVQAEARRRGRGVHSACSGDFHQPTR